jgi:hypothetical protein
MAFAKHLYWALLAGVLTVCLSAAAFAGAKLNPANVPNDLRPLIPLAERWGIGDDVDREAALARATKAEQQELRRAVEAHASKITEWLDTFGADETMSDEAAAFMYMQLAVDELPN